MAGKLITTDTLTATTITGSFTYKLTSQSVTEGIALYSLVCWDYVSNIWVVPTSTATPLGMLTATGEVTLFGYISGLSGLEKGMFYFQDLDDYYTLTKTTTSNIKIGVALSTTEMFLNISAEGTAVSTNIYIFNARGVFGGGKDVAGTNYYNTIDYIAIVSLGNATDFGDLTVARRALSALSSSTRGVFCTGFNAGGYTDTLDYITVVTTGNATDFGNLTATALGGSGTSSNTRGIITMGASNSIIMDTIEYITIATTGDSTDFGNLTFAKYLSAAFSSSTRSMFGGGTTTVPTNIIDYVTTATTGNATDFGDLSVTRSFLAGLSTSTRGIFGGGNNSTTYYDTIDYVTIAMASNATDFGNLTVGGRNALAGLSSSTRGVFAGGLSSGSTQTNIIDYITIASAGNATDFGDLSITRNGLAGLSDAHGGL